MASFDQLRRRVQAELFAGMPEHIGRLHWSADQIAARQQRDLRSLLAHAVEHAPFHARRLRHIDPESFELGRLAELPVMTKAGLMAHFDDIVTDRRLTLALAERALAATAMVPVPLFDRYVCVASGGSSGVRGVFVSDA